MNWLLGRITVVLAMLASPLPALRTAFTAGLPVRFILPLKLSFREGLKPNSPQPATWKGTDGVAVCPLEEVRTLVTCFGLQLVGLIVKSGRFTSTRTSR